MTNKSGFSTPLLQDGSGHRFASDEVIFVFSQCRVLEAQVRKGMVAQFNACVGPRFQEGDPSIGFSRHIEQRLIYKTDYGNLMSLNPGEQLVGHDLQSA